MKLVKKLIFVFLLLVSVICCSACEPRITSGEVYDKEYREARTVVQMMPLVISNGKTTTTRIVPYIVHYPERWVIFIKAFDEDEGKWITADFYVSEEVYNQINIGDMFEYDEERGDLDDEPYTQERE